MFVGIEAMKSVQEIHPLLIVCISAVVFVIARPLLNALSERVPNTTINESEQLNHQRVSDVLNDKRQQEIANDP